MTGSILIMVKEISGVTAQYSGESKGKSWALQIDKDGIIVRGGRAELRNYPK